MNCVNISWRPLGPWKGQLAGPDAWAYLALCIIYVLFKQYIININNIIISSMYYVLFSSMYY